MNRNIHDVPADPRTGALLLEHDATLPDIWRFLHSNGQLAAEVEAATDNPQEILEMLNHADLSLLSRLTSCPAERWTWLCNGAGWTLTGAAALSWCADAAASDVWSAWERANAGAPRPLSSLMRPARLVHRSLIPSVGSLSELIAATEGEPIRLAVALVQLRSLGPFDIENERPHLLPEALQPLLAGHPDQAGIDRKSAE